MLTVFNYLLSTLLLRGCMILVGAGLLDICQIPVCCSMHVCDVLLCTVIN